jgi:hypothetical protein
MLREAKVSRELWMLLLTKLPCYDLSWSEEIKSQWLESMGIMQKLGTQIEGDGAR